MAHDSGNATWQNGSSGGTKLNATHLENIENAIDGKADSADLGTAATVDTGTASGDIPLLGTGGVLAPARLGTGTPSSSNFLRGDGSWTAPSGSGDVSGPASSTDGNLAVFDGTGGKTIKDGGAPFSGSYDDLTGAPSLADVATSGSYDDLTGTPSLADVATSGSYDDLTDTPTIPDSADDVDAAADVLTITAKTASYTLALGDGNDHVVEVNSSSAATVTVPPNSSVAFPVGTVITVCRLGSGSVTIAAGSGVTINNPLSVLTLRAQYSECSLRKRDTDSWVIAGDLG